MAREVLALLHIDERLPHGRRYRPELTDEGLFPCPYAFASQLEKRIELTSLPAL